jgi:hypothetical protein
MERYLKDCIQRPLVYIEQTGGIIPVCEKTGSTIGKTIGQLIYFLFIPLICLVMYTGLIILRQLKKLKKEHIIALTSVLNIKTGKKDTRSGIEDQFSDKKEEEVASPAPEEVYTEPTIDLNDFIPKSHLTNMCAESAVDINDFIPKGLVEYKKGKELTLTLDYSPTITEETEMQKHMPFNYKGYVGDVTIDFSQELAFSGRVGCIRDIIDFYGRNYEEAEQAFKDSIDDYLEWCAKTGESPQVPS